MHGARRAEDMRECNPSSLEKNKIYLGDRVPYEKVHQNQLNREESPYEHLEKNNNRQIK